MTTKLELTQLLATRNADLEAARLSISVLEGELALRPRASAPVLKPLRVYTPPAPSADVLMRRAAMAQAKAAAMAHGYAVLARI